jgi:hypothetical protein
MYGGITSLQLPARYMMTGGGRTANVKTTDQGVTMGWRH